jgi:hypothetical protein
MSTEARLRAIAERRRERIQRLRSTIVAMAEAVADAHDAQDAAEVALSVPEFGRLDWYLRRIRDQAGGRLVVHVLLDGDRLQVGFLDSRSGKTKSFHLDDIDRERALEDVVSDCLPHLDAAGLLPKEPSQ